MPPSARMQQKQWVVRPTDGQTDKLAQSLRVSPLIAQVLVNREVTDPDAASIFLRPKLTGMSSETSI